MKVEPSPATVAPVAAPAPPNVITLAVAVAVTSESASIRFAAALVSLIVSLPALSAANVTLA